MLKDTCRKVSCCNSVVVEENGCVRILDSCYKLEDHHAHCHLIQFYDHGAGYPGRVLAVFSDIDSIDIRQIIESVAALDENVVHFRTHKTSA